MSDVSKNMQVLDKGGLSTLVDQVKLMFKEEIANLGAFEVVDIRGPHELPNVGSANTIYAVISEYGDMMYRWDDIELRYRIMGTNYNNIELIRGGNAAT